MSVKKPVLKLSKDFSVDRNIVLGLTSPEINDIDKLTVALGADRHDGFAIYHRSKRVGFVSDIRVLISREINANKPKQKEYLTESKAELESLLSTYATNNADKFYIDETTLSLVSRNTGQKYYLVASKTNKIAHACSIAVSRLDIPKVLEALYPKYKYVNPKTNYAEQTTALLIRPLSVNDYFDVINLLDRDDLLAP